MNSITQKSAAYAILKGINSLPIDGDVYLDRVRPLDSQKQDIVVGSLQVNGNRFKMSTVMIDCFVPDLYTNGHYVPNYSKLTQLADLLQPVFDKKYYQNIYFEVEGVTDYKIENRNEHAVVIRLLTRTTKK